MTYKHLIQFIKENEDEFPATQIAKFKSDKSTKLIFLVGEDASNTASFLSSVMNTKSINLKDSFARIWYISKEVCRILHLCPLMQRLSVKLIRRR